jgi:hypothetical protein
MRRLKSWIGGFLDYTKNVGSPEIWRRWTAISILGGALERRVGLKTARGILYPNTFVMLVGPPAAGKSIIIEEARKFWTDAGGLFLAPSAITRAGMIDILEESRKTILTPDGPMIYHPMLVASSEFGNLVPAYENDWINQLNELYDCGVIFRARTRALGEKVIEGPYMHIVAGTQPQYLRVLLPEEAFGMGFFSRFILIYSGSAPKTSIFDAPEKNKKLAAMLRSDLEEVVELIGDFSIDEEAKAFYEEAYKNSFAPQPEHPKLQHYNGRRIVHILKIAMAVAVGENSDLILTKSHIETALHYLHDAERHMPQIFTEMSTHGFADVNHEVHQFAQELYIKTKKPIPQAKLIFFLQGKIPNVQIMPTLETMIKAGMFKRDQLKFGTSTIDAYTPLDPKEIMLR